MSNPYARDQIDNWVSDFCQSDGLSRFTPGLRDIAGEVLTAFLTAASEARQIEPADIEEPDAKAALLGTVARLAIPEALRGEVPALCGALLTALEMQGRLSGGSAMGAFVGALHAAYLEAASGKPKPITRAGSKIGRNDPCPCGSGKKYKKCCMRE